jgi:hypothetical protein
MSDASSDLIQDDLDIERLNPTGDAFTDYGLRDADNRTYIPNRSLEFRDTTPGARADSRSRRPISSRSASLTTARQ